MGSEKMVKDLGKGHGVSTHDVINVIEQNK